MLGKLKYHDGRVSEIQEIPQDIKDKYKEVFEIAPRWLIKVAAHRGKWVDQSQSLNIFYSGQSGKEISDIYTYAWEMGLKTTYYMRTLAVSQVEKSTVNTTEFGQTHNRKQTDTPQKEEGGAPAVPTPPVAMTVPAPAGPLAPTPQPIEVRAPIAQVQRPTTPEVKLCRIEDPDCEACQ